MGKLRSVVAVATLMLTGSLLWAQSGRVAVQVRDHGANTAIAGPTAPKHVIGLPRMMHDISLNTGKITYALRYTICHDPKAPTVGIPGEGYIGMPQPNDANWYSGGFFDLKLNGQSIGSTMAQTFSGRSTGDRGYVDYVFDDPQAVVRLRFVALAGDDCLHAQLLIEPKVELTQVSVNLRCYPSGFVNRSAGAERHALTATKDLKVGERLTPDPAAEYWVNFYDAVYDAGVVMPTATGRGSCSLLWIPAQLKEASFNVGDYGSESVLELDPSLRDFRFVFFDHTGVSNADAQAALRSRAPELLEQLAGFAFADSSVADWPLAKKLAEARTLLADLPEDKAAAERYDQWSRELEEHLALLKATGQSGAIVAEGKALGIIAEWDNCLPDLRLQALLNTF